MWSQTGVKDKWSANGDPEAVSYVSENWILAEWVVGYGCKKGFSQKKSPLLNRILSE